MDKLTAVYGNRTFSYVSLDNLGKFLTLLVLLAATVAASATPVLSRVSCGTNTYSGAGTDACSVYLTSNTGSTVQVALTSNNPAVAVPTMVTVGAGATSTGFNATVAGVTTTQTATITAQARGVTTYFFMTLWPQTGMPALSLNATSLSFGNVSVGTAVTKSVTVTSSGTAAVTINSDSISGTGFSVSGGTFPATLNPGQAAVLTVQFNPTTASSATGLLTIASNAPTATVSLSGTGTTVVPTVSSVNCNKNTITGAFADSCTVRLSSNTSSTVQVALTSNNPAVAVPTTVTVGSGATSTGFNATVAGVTTTQTATITAQAGGVATYFFMTLWPETALPALSLNATSLSFGNVSVGTAVTKSVIVTSSGTAAVTINSDSISGTGFSVSGGTFPATLNPGQAAVLTVQFNPTTASSTTGQLTISSNAPTATVGLSGTGTTVVPTVSTVSCSSTSITGSLADACTVSLSGSAPTGGVSVSLASSSSAVTVPSSVTVPATAKSAAFTANAASVGSAQSVTLTASGSTSQAVVSLQLNAATGALSLNATSISFGNVVVNTATTQTVTMTSSGSAAVTVNSASVSGTGFSVTGAALPVTLNPGQSLTLDVQFDPGKVGSYAGQLTIASSASTQTITLSGTGESFNVNLSWNAPSGSSAPIAGYNVYRSPSGTTSYQRLNSTVGSLAAFTDGTVQIGQNYNYFVTSVDTSGVESAPSNVATVTIP